ncbi:MAG: hypothetical protein U0625_04325 [Phycisphaerales bacterium]
MDRALRLVCVVVTALLLAAGGGGLRAMHIAAEHPHGAELACKHSHFCHSGHDGHTHHRAGDTDHHTPGHDAPGHEDEGCATCELLLGLAGLAGTPVPVPAFHALVAVADPHTPVVASDPLPLRATAARPPPSC